MTVHHLRSDVEAYRSMLQVEQAKNVSVGRELEVHIESHTGPYCATLRYAMLLLYIRRISIKPLHIFFLVLFFNSYCIAYVLIDHDLKCIMHISVHTVLLSVRSFIY